jgi:hypothetical protein
MTADTLDPGAERHDLDRGAGEAARLRAELVEALRAEGKISSAAVASAVGAVPRERFLPPGTPLSVAYGVDSPVVTKGNERGEPVSSVSAAYIQARMLEQALLRPGMTVLEIGSGGLNAAMIAEVVGEQGRVVSVDIDSEVAERARGLLEETTQDPQLEQPRPATRYPPPTSPLTTPVATTPRIRPAIVGPSSRRSLDPAVVTDSESSGPIVQEGQAANNLGTSRSCRLEHC